MNTPELSPAFEKLKSLIDSTSLASLTPNGRSGTQAPEELNAQLNPILKSSELASRKQELIRGLILLWHDHLDAAHSIAQSIDDSDGSLLHAIMHRREPDYSNSKYWFRNAGRHKCYSAIAEESTRFLKAKNPNLLSRLVPNGAWDPFAFVDACEAAERVDTPSAGNLKELQKIEFVSFLESLI